jgi:nicotinamide-nucleotide amidase
MGGQGADPLAAEVGAALARAGLSLVTAESCTGGWVAQRITSVAGSSSWFDRGFVTYSNAAKCQMLGLAPALLDTHGAVSEATVLAMAAGALARCDAGVAVAVSGVAGPGGGSEAKPVGSVWIAWHGPRGGHARGFLYPGDREAVRRQATDDALRGVLALLRPGD